MKTSIVIGMGELGSVFAHGLLKSGHQVIPVLRGQNIAELEQITCDSVWLCVGEKDLHATLELIPKKWHNQLILIQNELLPQDWKQHNIEQPTVLSVWFEKKAGKLPQVVLPSVVFGSLSETVLSVYQSAKLPARALNNADELLFELVLKNLYIQTTNICGLKVGGNTQQLVEVRGALMQKVAHEVIQLQEALTQHQFDQQALMKGFIEACYGDPNHGCMGRSAPARLSRALTQAAQLGLTLPTLTEIQSLQ